MKSTSKKYEIRSGDRLVSIQFSVSPLQAVLEYVRSYGVKDDEITRLGVDCVAWQGARFNAVLVPTESPLDDMRVTGMTPEQRDSLRKEIDVRVRERMGGLSKRGGTRPAASRSPRGARCPGHEEPLERRTVQRLPVVLILVAQRKQPALSLN